MADPAANLQKVAELLNKEDMMDVAPAPDTSHWDDEVAIRRYIFIRSPGDPHYVQRDSLVKKPIKNIDFGENSIETHLKSLASRNPPRVHQILYQTSDSQWLRSREEHLWCVAFCLQRLKIEEISKALRKEFANFIDTPRDLLVFANFFKFWSSANEEKQDEAQETLEEALDEPRKSRRARRKKRNVGGRLSFGRGMKTCLKRWYDSLTSDELIDVIHATPAVNGINHVDILHLLHLYGEKKKKTEGEKCSEEKEAKRSKVSSPKPPPDALKKMIVESTYWNQKDLDEKEKQYKNEWIFGHKMRKVIVYRRAKQQNSVEDLCNILNKASQEMKFKKNHLPPKSFKSDPLLKIVDGMPLNEILDVVASINHRKMHMNPQLMNLIRKNFNKTNTALKAAKMNPFELLELKRFLETRYFFKGREYSPEFKETLDKLLLKFKEVMEKILVYQPRIGCRYYVTLDVRNFSKRKAHVHGMERITCTELQIIFALLLAKTERHVIFKAFTDQRNVLIDVPWNSTTTYKEATNWVAKHLKTVQRTKEHFVFSMKKAEEDRVQIDLFVTFVSSIARTVGKNATPPLKQLQAYRAATGMDKAKIVLVNLSRPEPDFVYDKRDEAECGVLEMNGFDRDGMKIIAGYGEGIFK